MSSALQAVRDELVQTRRHVDALQRAEALLAGEFAAIEVPPRPTSPARRRAGRRPTKRGAVRDYVIEHGPLTRRELVAALGGSPGSVDNHLKRLLDQGDIAADGAPGQRQYYAPSPNTPVVPVRAAAVPAPAPPVDVPERGVYPVFDAICDLGGATTLDLAEATELPVSHVVEQGRRLLQLRLVRFEGDGESRLWIAMTNGDQP